MSCLLSIYAALDTIETDKSLLDDYAFPRRADAIDQLEFLFLGDFDATEGERAKIKQGTESLLSSFLVADDRLFAKLREAIRSGDCRGMTFREEIGKFFDAAVLDSGRDRPGYDTLDIFFNRLFPVDETPEPAGKPEPEMVAYQKTPARVILELVERCNFNQEDVFVDMGSGLGQAAIMVNLLAGIRSIGIEFDPAFCEFARMAAASLQLPDVRFINADARRADLSQGTVFYMFTPFRGGMLEAVLQRLRRLAAQRRIKFITYGPCTLDLAGQDWLVTEDEDVNQLYRPVIFRSR